MKREINVLLFGSSGNGKSTWLNAFNQMASYKTLTDAQGDVCQVAIPVRCTRKRVPIREGQDNNEREGQACSRTVYPRIYVFPAREVILRIIDTPGIGDTAGAQEDQKHIGHILSCITRYKQIHGILFVFKNSDNKLSPFLRYQLCELFSCLGKSAVNNIKFVMTHAGPLCQPADADDVIDAFMKTINLNIPCTDENRFYFENDPFLYLVGKQNPENNYTDEDEDLQQVTYKKTARGYIRLLRALFTCQTPYNVSNLTALEKARQLWPHLKPLLGVLDNKEKEIKKAIHSHNVTLKELMWQITGETAMLVKYEVEKYKEMVKKEKITMEEEEVDVQVPTIESKDVTEKVPFQRIEQIEKQRDQVRYRVDYETVTKNKTRWVHGMVKKERPVQKQKRVSELGSILSVFGAFLGASFGGNSNGRWETYTENEEYEEPGYKEVTKRVNRQVPKVVTDNLKETYYEPVVKDELREVTRQVQEVVYRTEKKKQVVPKVEQVLEEEEKERLVQVIDAEVQKRIDEKETVKVAEEALRAEREAEYEQFLKEKEQVRSLVDDAARCLLENSIVALNYAKGQYLKEELKVQKKSQFDAEAVDWLKNRLVEAETSCTIFDNLPDQNINREGVLTPIELLDKVEKLCQLKYFGQPVREALLECENYNAVEFPEVILKDAAKGYMFDEMVKSF